ncbi:MAG: histidinol dehydrogenase [Oligoflexus sp.]
MIQIIDWQNHNPEEQQVQDCLQRPVSGTAESLRNGVKELIADVRSHGDDALRRLTERFDKVAIKDLEVTPEEFSEAWQEVSAETKQAIEEAIKNIETFHKQQQSPSIDIEIQAGVRCLRQSRPIERVGLYAPGGTAPLPSTVIMLAVPAKLAGCPIKILCTPPNKEGKVNPHILTAAKLAGIERIFKVGGAQAIAAMAFGTESIPKVDKIFGPGNSWVTEAKLQVAQDPLGATYDMPAGPSEVLVIADESARAEFIAADLLSQAEHGHDSQAILLTTSPELATKTRDEVLDQATRLSRQSIVENALNFCRIIICQDLEQCIRLSNQYAPEHLIVQTAEAETWIPKIQNAGSVFLGPWSPESVGDYASGTNHVLPTYGYAKSISGLSVDSFTKQITFQQLSSAGLARLGPTVERLAELEGLDAHRQAVSVRLAALREGKL